MGGRAGGPGQERDSRAAGGAGLPGHGAASRTLERWLLLTAGVGRSWARARARAKDSGAVGGAGPGAWFPPAPAVPIRAAAPHFESLPTPPRSLRI